MAARLSPHLKGLACHFFVPTAVSRLASGARGISRAVLNITGQF